MRYITDHKRATGLGSAGTGTTKHWFIASYGRDLGGLGANFSLSVWFGHWL